MGESGVVAKYRTEPPPAFKVRLRGDLGDFGEPRGDEVMPGLRLRGVLEQIQLFV
jgi:hypothetical protein